MEKQNTNPCSKASFFRHASLSATALLGLAVIAPSLSAASAADPASPAPRSDRYESVQTQPNPPRARDSADQYSPRGVTRDATETSTYRESTDVTQRATSLSESDQKLVREALKHCQETSATSQIAAERASQPGVRSYASQVNTAHRQISSELNRLASSRGVTQASEQPDHENARELRELSGARFDQRFVEDMVDSQQDTLNLYEEIAEEAEDRELAAWAGRQIPVIQQQLTQAQTLAKTLR